MRFDNICLKKSSKSASSVKIYTSFYFVVRIYYFKNFMSKPYKFKNKLEL